MEHRRLGFIGAGNMAFAIASGVISQVKVTVFDTHPEQYERFRAIGAETAGSLSELAAAADVLFFSVKPQNFEEVLGELAKTPLDEGKLFVSIAAGITTSYIKKMLPMAKKVVRVMPNTPLMVGAGAAAISPAEGVPEEDVRFVQEVFSAAGVARLIDEAQMDAVVSVNGSSPAFLYYFADIVARHAAERGIEEKTALALFCQTMIGSAKMLMESGHTPEELITMVSSKGGTTIAAMDALRANGFEAAVIAAMDACEKRSGELSK